MANSVGSAAKSSSRLCFTFVNVTTPMAPRTPLPTKFAVAEKHTARHLPCKDYTYRRGTQNICHDVVIPSSAKAVAASNSSLELSGRTPSPLFRDPSKTMSRATISVRYFLSPLRLSSQVDVCSLPSTYTLEPLATYSPTISARRCHAT